MWGNFLVKALEGNGAELVSDATQFKELEEVIVIPVVIIVRISGEELEPQSIPNSPDGVFGELTKLPDVGV